MRERIRVAHVLDCLQTGGAERILVALANNLDKDQHDVHVITTRYPGELAGELANHVTLHSLNRRSRCDLAALNRFHTTVRDNDISIVHTHSHSSAYFVRVARKIFGGRWQHVMHDHHGPVASSPWLKKCDRWLLRRVDHYWGVSEQLVDYAVREIGIASSRCQLLYNGVQLPVPNQTTPTSPFTVVQCARVVSEKNQLMALDVAADLRTEIPDLRWYMVGRDSGQYADQCFRAVEQRSLQANVHFVGQQRDIGTYLAQAHVGVLTSRAEGLPLALLEYMAVGLPVVVTDVGACRLLVERSGGGVVTSVADVAGFSRALLELVSDPERRQEWGRKNRTLVEDHFSIAAMTRDVAAVYDRLKAMVPQDTQARW